MLPISILPIAGLLLGIGGAISSNLTGDTAQQVAKFFFSVSGIVFANLPLLFGAATAMTFTRKNKNSATFIFILGYLVFTSMQDAFIHYDAAGNFKDILWFHTDPKLAYMIGKNLGITSMQTSIFGGMTIGALTSWIMNKWSDIEFVPSLSFFSGIRFVPIIMMPFVILTSLIFLIFWPFVGQMISTLGTIAASAPGGTDGLLYGMLGRSLMPFGLHHIVIGLAWQTPLGGELTLPSIINAAESLGVAGDTAFGTIKAAFEQRGAVSIIGDHNIWNFINGLPLKSLPVSGGESLPIYKWIAVHTGTYAGRFTQDYPIYLGATQGIGAALIYTAHKEKRKKTMAIIGSAMLVAFLTGITEPLEFSFLFIAPLFYYLIYVPLSGLAYMLMKLAGAHVGVGFARGFIDYIIYGALPAQKGTRFLWAIPLSILFAIIGFVTFTYMIKKFDWKTPGREDDEDVELIDKKIYKEKKFKNSKTSNADIDKIVKFLGGPSNIENVFACASRLRVTVKKVSVIDQEGIKGLGASGIIQKDKNVQAIFGGKSTILAEKINSKYNF